MDSLGQRMILPSIEEQEAKFRICSSCKHFTPDKDDPDAGVCGLCGCWKSIPGLSASTCPLGYWRGWDDKVSAVPPFNII